MSEPRIYVACLGCYNEGRLVGKWMDADGYADYEHKCKRPYHEEYAIHDYDAMPNLGEYPDSEKVVEVAEAVSEYGYDIVKDFIGWGFQDVSRIPDAFITTLDGWNHNKELGEYLIHEMEMMIIPDGMSHYFNYEAYGRDASIDIVFMSDEGNVFWRDFC